MERKIGEIFEYNGEWYQCVEGTGCYKCCFNFNEDTCIAENPHCTCRSDRKNVVYKKLEKIGEPFVKSKYCPAVYTAWRPYITVQRYRVSPPVIMPEEPYMYFNAINNTIEIETKQNQEDMEEKELNLKPFDIQKAREGKPVCTRDGRKARIVCFDAKGDQPIIALVEAKGNKDALIEKVERYFINGHSVFEVRETNDDLMMLPEKKEGWVNIYNNGGTYYSKYIYKTEKEATGQADTIYPNHVATVKIEWEE